MWSSKFFKGADYPWVAWRRFERSYWSRQDQSVFRDTTRKMRNTVFDTEYKKVSAFDDLNIF